MTKPEKYYYRTKDGALWSYNGSKLVRERADLEVEPKKEGA